MSSRDALCVNKARAMSATARYQRFIQVNANSSRVRSPTSSLAKVSISTLGRLLLFRDSVYPESLPRFDWRREGGCNPPLWLRARAFRSLGPSLNSRKLAFPRLHLEQQLTATTSHCSLKRYELIMVRTAVNSLRLATGCLCTT